MAKIQKQGIKTEAEILAAGGAVSDLPNDSQIYVTANGLNKTLDDAITDGDIAGSPLTTKGDLYTRNAGADTRLPVGADGTFLKADSAQSTGLSWASTISTSAFRSVTSTDTATTSDDILVLSGASFTETLFTASGNAGKIITLIHNGTSLTQVYTLNTTGGQTIGGVASGSYALYTNGEMLKIISDGSNWLILEHKTKNAPVSYTPTIGATTTAPTEGSGATKVVTWDRDGQYMNILFRYYHTAAGSAGNGAYLFPLPANTTIDTAVAAAASVAPSSTLNGLNTNIVGAGVNINNNATDANFAASFRIGIFNSTNLYGLGDATNGAQMKTVSSGSAINFGNTTLFISFFAKVPISGWRP